MILIALLLLSVRTAEPRHALRDERTALASGAARDTETGDTDTWPNPNRIEGVEIIKQPKRIPRGAKDGSSNKRDQSPHNYWHPRAHDPDSYFTTPKSAKYPSGGAPNHGSRTNSSDKVTVFLHNPLYPVTESSYGAYAVMLLALILFAVGIVGNLALMCIVWHNYYLKSAWNCILASLAFWDFLVLFFCLPVVIFNELTTKRLMGDLSCRIVPYMEITSQGVATFSLCALSIDRFHAATAPRTQRSSPRVEPCHSILAKLAVIWLGSLVLAGPELLLWQLDQGGAPRGGPPGAPVGLRSPRDAADPRAARGGGVAPPPADTCVRRPSMDLPESVYALVLTYHEARMWWYFGCYFCLPLLFTLACQLVTRHVAAQEATPEAPAKKQAGAGGGRPSSSSTSSSSTSSSSSAAPKKKAGRERRLSSAVAALALVYAACNLPENACGVALAYVTGPVSPGAEAVIALVGQFLMFARCAATPVLLLSLCRPLGRAFMDCCCCCCDECLPDGGGGASSSSAASTIATATSACSSPTSLSPPSLPAPTAAAEKVKVVSGGSPTIYYDRVKESSAVLAIGTPC